METDEESPADEGFQLPTADHDWVAASEWWRPLIWARSHTDQVARWVEQELERSSEQWLSVDWLRCLTHKIAWERHSVGALNALRQAYGTSACAELLERDAAFATAEQLGSYGGPWYTQLGLDHPTRTAPFATTGATEPPAELEPAQVTVLIPSYKHERFIADTIHSVLRQTTGAFRLLVVDDRSPDGTVDAARAIEDPRLEVRVNERNLGLGNSVVEALRRIDTPFVALLNSDDLFHPERLQRCLEVLDADPQAQIVTTSLHLIDDRNGELTPDNVSMALDGLQVFNWVHWYEDANVTGELSPDALFKELLQRNFLATSSNLTARTDWLRSKAEAFQNLKYCLDWQIFLDAALEGSLRHLDQPLVGYRLHASNTVWFDDGGRWAFYLEVSRVITEAVRHYAARRGELDEPLALDIVTATADHIALNREADGLALFLNSVLDSLTLDRIAAESAPVQELLRKMRQRAAERLALADHEVDERQLRRLELRTLIATCERDRLRGEKAALRERLDANEARITRLRGELDQERGRREQMAANLAQLRARQAATEQRVADLREDSKQAQRRAEERIAALRDHEHGLRQRIQRMEEARTQLRARVAELEQRAVELRERLDERRQQLKTAQENFAAARSKLRSRDEELARQTEARNAAEAAAHERALELEAERAKSAAATAEQARLQAESEQLRSEHAEAMERLDKRRAETVRQLTTTRAQLDEVSNSREFRTGNFIWNKLPFGYMSRRGKKWYNRILDVRDRFSMWASGKVRKPRAEGCAVVAATWQWPIYSHTFVYQEMLALTQMGLEVRLFHWKANDFKEMQPAFAPLKESRVEMRPSLPQHRNDRDYWDKQLPGKLDKLLERVGQLVGRTVEDLREDPHVLRACTFARNAEHVGATYLHSYFFYDQSFMVMVTSWLLDLPRGVSCYADHMMDDYPFKLVALQIELASVVVATSARIKQELVDIAGAEHADKIIVKPNGVNGERFPAIDRGERKPDEPFEVISISRLEPKKGLEYMIDAVAELKKRGRKIKVHIIGAVDTSIQASIDYGVELEQQIAQLGLGDEVILHGMMMHEQIQPIMQRCRAFVAPYVELESGDKDGIPTAMLEALASGLPVVTTDSGSILEVVQDGVQALVTPQRDSAAYAEALDKLITDPAFERKLAEAARKRFDQEFDIKVTERRLHERVAAALQQKAAAAR
ncbi:MAG: glycosyltransferase [Planctomycetes bacterium]|nr:glycosyltransferase [Planctomycetota bacterium]